MVISQSRPHNNSENLMSECYNKINVNQATKARSCMGELAEWRTAESEVSGSNPLAGLDSNF